MIQQGDIPLITEFDPNDVKWQMEAIDAIADFDYSLGVHQVLFSGSVGSAKTLLMAHLIVKHCLENPNAWAGIGRLTMTDLKDTLLYVILEHIGEEGYIIDYDHNKTRAEITFCNGSKISCFSWHDKKYKKFRSYPFTLFAIEELTENDTKEAYEAILMRLGRSRGVREKLLLMATNPDEPEHWVFETIVEKAGLVQDIKILQDDGTFLVRKGITIHVFYSLTKDNIFLDPSYHDFLERNLDPLRGLAYVSLQEVATRVAHRNTGRYSKDPVADEIMKRISADENLHATFYRDILVAASKLHPSATVEAVVAEIMAFEMPGAGIRGFRRKAAQMALAGIYDTRVHLDQIVMPLVKRLRIFELEGLSAEAETARTDLADFLEDLKASAKRHDERRARVVADQGE